ncbi:hypothetical protein GKA01_21200 [Gluconobacter kanchanaburiensis NBRC 103587]|uniref:Uncharacterized protein n=1 Tax=Gluconobacter kanchanaburiensis NBRC 103587 TaxID=1307948 RepID=A0A511BBC6_9PROT|nr:hypothetical protein GKA01_21200 [Gluconobacter kanchanaburiensis NBRC 103587]
MKLSKLARISDGRAGSDRANMPRRDKRLCIKLLGQSLIDRNFNRQLIEIYIRAGIVTSSQ